GVIPTIANALLPKILRPIFSKYPDLHIEIREATTPDITRQLREGTLDLGILSTPLDMDEIEENVLYYELLMVYGDKDPTKQFMLTDEIRQHKVWMLEEGHCLREQFMQLCSLKEKQQTPQHFSYEAGSFDTLLNLVDEFGGLTLIPELYYQTLPDKRKAKVSYFKSPLPVREVSLVYFRPFAKHRIIHALSRDIREMIVPELMSSAYKKHELEITRI
ncbi:MAG: LysR substrate-binding domain-containing protein, partial [Cyclobacteriaceae bacterium]